MRAAVLLGLLMLASPIAGCIGNSTSDADPASTAPDPVGDELAPKQFDVLPPEEIWVDASDEKGMNNVVYRPDTNESVPVFINFSPYWGDSADERGDPFAQYMIEEYVPRGYAVVLSAVRGTGHSEGCFQIGSDLEVQDLHDVIDRFANAEWSNGNVIAGGKSYDSTSQNGLIAKNPHPDLEGIFHVSGITDMYRYTYRQGVPYVHGPIFNTYYYGQTVHEYGATGAPGGSANLQNEDADSLSRAVDDAACPELPEMQAHGVGTGVHGMKTDYWIERDWNRYVDQTEWNGSIFFVHGFQDWNVKPDHILPWLDRLPDDVEVKGWLHQDVQDGTGHVYPMRADWNETMLRWLEHEGKGKDTGLEWGFEAEGTDGVWRESETWPPRSTQATRVPVEASDESRPRDPANVTATVELPREEGELVRLAGEPTLTLEATATTPDPVVVAKLYKVGPDGERTWINEAIQRGIYRNGLEQPEPVPVGEPVTYELTFYPQDDVIEPSEKLELVLGERPRHGIPLWTQGEPVEFHTDTLDLELPLAPTDTAVEAQPQQIDCFAC